MSYLRRLPDVVTKARPRAAEWRKLDRLARRFEPEFRRAFLRAVRAAGEAIELAPIVRALEAGNIAAAVEAVPLAQVAPILQRDLVNELRSVYDMAGQISATIVPRVDPYVFDVLSTRGLEVLQARGAELVTAVTDSTRVGIREALTLARQEGMSAQRAAKLVRPMIGLIQSDKPGGPKHATAVVNRALRLQAQGIAQDAIDREVASYALRLRQHRALMIARTEPRFAAVAGQREAWEQAIDRGIFVRSEIRRRWITVDADHVPNDPCPGLDGLEVGIDEAFVHPETGELFFQPPDPHPHCTCQLEVVFVD